MSNLYKILIVVTAVISIFFFIKWVDEVWPRYEWMERIETNQYYARSFAEYCEETEVEKDSYVVMLTNFTTEDCEIIQYNDLRKACFVEDEWYYIVAGDIYEKRSTGMTETVYNCYYKEKVRTN